MRNLEANAIAKPGPSRCASAGMTLIEVMMGVGVLVAIAGGYSQYNYQQLANLKARKKSQQVIALRGFVREFLSCDATLQDQPAAGCPTDKPIDAKQGNGQDLIDSSSSVTQVGKFLLKASCRNRDIQVSYAEAPTALSGSASEVVSAGGFSITKVPQTTAINSLPWQDLFNGIPIRCQLPPTPSPPPAISTIPSPSPIPVASTSTVPSSMTPSTSGHYGCESIEQIVTLGMLSDPGRSAPPPSGVCRSSGDKACSVWGPVWRRADRNDGVRSEMKFNIKGNAAQWKLSVATNYRKGNGLEEEAEGTWAGNRMLGGPPIMPISMNPPVLIKPAAGMQTAAGEYSLTLADLQTSIGNQMDRYEERSINLTVAALDASGQQSGPICLHRMNMSSPIVFDLAGMGVPLFSGAVKFDLNADGIKESMTWIAPTSGLLALDINNNGSIDNGMELFGNHTWSSSAAGFEEGYSALSQYDSNQDGKIDADDLVFPHLLLWTDENMNGVSEPAELSTIEAAGITEIGLHSERLPAALDRYAGNDLRFKGYYKDSSRCRRKKCDTFDIFFATNVTIVEK